MRSYNSNFKLIQPLTNSLQPIHILITKRPHLVETNKSAKTKYLGEVLLSDIGVKGFGNTHKPLYKLRDQLFVVLD